MRKEFFSLEKYLKKTKTKIYREVGFKIIEIRKNLFNHIMKETRPDTRHKMRLVCVLLIFENNTGRTYGPTDGHELL